MRLKEFLDNYEYKVTKRLLKKEFPFITDVLPSDNFEDYKTLSFVFIVIDLQKLIDMYKELKLEPFGYIEYLPDSTVPGYIYGPTLYFFVDGPEDSAENTKEILMQLNRDIEATIDSIRLSPSIPSDLKLEAGISNSGYLIPKSSIPNLEFSTASYFRRQKKHNPNT